MSIKVEFIVFAIFSLIFLVQGLSISISELRDTILKIADSYVLYKTNKIDIYGFRLELYEIIRPKFSRIVMLILICIDIVCFVIFSQKAFSVVS